MPEVRRDGAVGGLADVWASLLAVGRDLDESEFDRPSACPGWTVRDQFSHVIGTELLLEGHGAPPAPARLGPHVRNELGALNERFVAARRGRPGRAVLAELEALVARRLALLGGLEAEAAGAVGDGATGIVPYVDYVSARTVDAFVHEQDVRTALGRPGGRGGLAERAALDRMEASMAFVLTRRVAAAPGTTLRVEVAGAQGRVLQLRVGRDDDGRPRAVATSVIEGPPTASVHLDEETFVRRAAGRLSAAAARRAPATRAGGDLELAERFVGAMVVVA